MREVPNRIMFSEMKEINVSVKSFNKNGSSYLTLRTFQLQLNVCEMVTMYNLLKTLEDIFLRI
jgi:hypothetical protein